MENPPTQTEDKNSHYIGKRIIFKHEKATVLYAGNLLHDIENPKLKANDLWFGVEWDNPEKGKKNFH